MERLHNLLTTQILTERRRNRELEERVQSLFALVADLLSGHVLEGRYALEHLVRSDAFGSLYEAIDLEQREAVLVQVLHAMWPADMSAPAGLHHFPHSAEILALGVAAEGLPFAVMEPLSGEAISERVARGRAISPGEAQRWGISVAEALAAAHELGQAHGRLTPAAVFLHRADTAAQAVKVLGFEAGVLIPRAAPINRAEAAALGSFCPPERWQRTPPSPAGDVYALAVLLGVLYAGRMPPGHDELGEWLGEVLPGHLVGLGRRSLAADPGERPGARAFVDAIGFARQARV